MSAFLSLACLSVYEYLLFSEYLIDGLIDTSFLWLGFDLVSLFVYQPTLLISLLACLLVFSLFAGHALHEIQDSFVLSTLLVPIRLIK